MARFIGGPCNGQTAPSDTALRLTCGGVQYILLDDLNYHLPSAVGGLPGGGDLNTKQVGSAWARFTRALGVDGPRAIRRSKASRKRLGRIVR